LHIAIVDDEEQIRKALLRLARASGLHAEAFASGQLFIDSLAVKHPDCVILDLHMPEMTGLQVLQHLRSSNETLPAIVITAFDEPQTCARCLAAGASAYLRKPIDDVTLLKVVAEATRK